MDFEAVTKYVLDQFKSQGVRCAIIGGFALHAAGFPRATKDIDFLVHVDDLSKVKSILTGFGYDILHESKDVINFWGKLKELGGIDFIIAHRKYALAMLPKSKPYEIVKGCVVNVVIPEDIIGLKLQAMANDPSRVAQDMIDVQWLIRNHHQVLNKELLKEYFGLFGQETILEDIYKEIDHAK